MSRFKRIKQPEGSPLCAAAVAAMICGTSIEDFQKLWKHEGPYSDTEVVIYCWRHGWQMGGVGFDIPKSLKIVDDHVLSCRWSFQGSPAYVGVKSRNYPNTSHAVLWDGQFVLDPDPKTPEKTCIEDYDVEQVFPLYEMPYLIARRIKWNFTPDEFMEFEGASFAEETSTI